MMERESNNDVGTHDHEYDIGRYGQKTGLLLRVETKTADDGFRAEVRYYLQDSKYEKGQGHCAGECRGEWHGTRCSKKGKYEYRGRPFCGTHHPPRMFERTIKRRRAWKVKFDRDWDRSAYLSKVAEWERRAVKYLKMIAEGETNDPVGLAQMYLDERPEKPSD